MKTIKTTIFALCALLYSAVNAQQWQPTGNLTFFTDNGKKFFVILNGEKYNEAPETNVRIEELTNPYYSCKIIFEDENIAPITKNMVMVTDQNGVYHDVTYRIKEGGNGKYTIGTFPYSFVPVQQNMARPAGASVYRYGTPRQRYDYNARPATTTVVTQQPATTIVTQPVQTQTQTVVVTQPAPTMQVNVPGVSMTVTTPVVVPTTTTTTTVVTTPAAPPRHDRDRDRDDRNRYRIPVGAKVTVNWKGTWYPATVKDINARTNEYYIKYDGWSDSWNEWVGEDRIKGGAAK